MIYNRYLINNNEESKWIQLYLFSKGYGWLWTSDNILDFTSTDYPLIIEERNDKIIWVSANIHKRNLLIFLNPKKYKVFHVSNMMRKDKIKKLKSIN